MKKAVMARHKEAWMHLNKLVIKNFKKFRRAELEFSDGLTGSSWAATDPARAP